MGKTFLGIYMLSIFLVLHVDAENLRLLAHWPMNEGEGVSINDVSGNGHNGTLLNPESSKWVDGREGKALYFNNIPEKMPKDKNAVIKVEKLGGYDFSKGLTVTAWIKTPPQLHRSAQYEIIDNSPSGKGPGFRLLISWRMLMFYCADGKTFSAAKSSTATDAINADTWYHVATVYDGKTAKVYINGHLAGESPENVILPKGRTYISIGAMNTGNCYGFEGIISDLKLYSGAMSDAEIAKTAKGI
ncbi:MAG: hypothetical protein A2017_10520 [Lentisphaerae bacterium GWF2_44_16]|nr:MAG: hypothetical protein A2017_10520 [Lentisphaerae bacterium GWF2_44_16]